MSHLDSPLHPLVRDPIESERCPKCWRPGRMIAAAPPFQVWACPDCEPEVFER